MNWLYLILLLGVFQDKPYFVIFIEGRAFLNRNNVVTELKQGSAVFPEDKVQFENKKGSIRLAGKAGTFRLSSEMDPRKEEQTSSGVWATIAKSVLPTVVVKEMKARGAPISSPIEAETVFREYASPTRPMLVIDSSFVPVNPSFIKDSARNFFYLVYQQGDETINKRVPYTTNGGMLNMAFDERLFLVDGKRIGQNSIKEAKIFYYETSSKKSVFISPFNVTFKPFDSIKQELCLIISAVVNEPGNKSEIDAARKETMNYLLAYYGRLDEELFNSNYFPKLNCKKPK